MSKRRYAGTVPLAWLALDRARKALRYAKADCDDEWSTPNRAAVRAFALEKAQRAYDKARALWEAAGRPGPSDPVRDSSLTEEG